MMTKEQIKQVCNKHIDVLDQFAQSKHTTEIMKIGAYQQQLAIMRLCHDLLGLVEDNPGQET